jgi:general secretion pathway protein M
MKEWWQNLALREKQILVLGGAAVLLFVLYEIIWSPFTNKIDNMRTRVQDNQKLLTWMQNADKTMQTLTKSSTTQSQQLTGSLLGTMQTEINKSSLARHVTQLRQAENDSVQINLQKVDFDKLIGFITELSNRYGLIVSQITVMPTAIPGEVMADIVIKSL